MIINIILGIVASISLFYLFLYRRQIDSISRQLEFIKDHQTNKKISTEIKSKEVKKLAEDLNEMLTKQSGLGIEYKRKDDLLKETITSISHDIRTPLTSLDGYFQLLLESKNDIEKMRYIQIIENRIISVKEMLEQLFTYVKLENNVYDLELGEHCINEIICELVLSFYDDFKRNNIEPEISICEKALYGFVNEVGLKRALQNMINNTLIHGQDRFILDMIEENRNIIITIKNKYHENSKLDINKVFDKFYKADPSRTHNSTGLGLYIAKQLIYKMNGDINAFKEGEYFGIRVTICAVNK